MAGQRLKWWTLIAACFALFMAILDNLVVNIALPTISRELNATTTQLQWIVSAYTLIFASLQITAGGLGDRLGRKRWFLFGLGLFTCASLLGALSQNITMLIFARAVQGLGAAFIMPLSLSLISVAFPPEERGKALGIWSAISVSGLALGPIVGGFLVQYANWHWVFIINIPIGIIAFFVASAVVQESRDTSGTVALDIPGTVLITGAIASLTWGLIEAGNRGWGNTLILAAFAVAAVLTATFIAVEARTEKPMVPLRFFRSTTFSGANMDSFAISFLIAGVAFYLTLYLQNIHGFSPVRAGLAMLPMVFTMMVFSPISGTLIGRIGSRLLISIGMGIAGIGTLLFLRSGVHTSYLAIVPAYVVMGFGMSLIFAPMTTAVLNSVESEKSGVASAINGAIREIGTAFGIALLGTIMNRAYQSQYNATGSIVEARSNPALGPLRSLIDLVGSGASLAGRLIEDTQRFPGVPPALAAQLRDASSHAFITGMDRAIVISSGVIIVCSVVSFFLIKPPVAVTAPEPEYDWMDERERVPELIEAD
jgi:EmrB/QacA subfamily drug resistance transporter